MELNRREFLLTGAAGLALGRLAAASGAAKSVVSVVRIKNDKIGPAVEEAIDLLGGIARIAKGKERILLKPNLVSTERQATTKPEVIRALALLMQRAGKQVSIGEGSAAAEKFNVIGGEIFRTRKREILEPMQRYVFEQLGFAELGKTLRVPLVNLHCGEMAEVVVPDGFVYSKVTVQRALA